MVRVARAGPVFPSEGLATHTSRAVGPSHEIPRAGLPRGHRGIFGWVCAISTALVTRAARGPEIPVHVFTTEAAGDDVVHVGGSSLTSGPLELAHVPVPSQDTPAGPLPRPGPMRISHHSGGTSGSRSEKRNVESGASD